MSELNFITSFLRLIRFSFYRH